MVDFGKNLQDCNSVQNLKAESELRAVSNSDIATAEYSFFHIHQIKAWAGWAVNQEEINYIVDPPCSLKP